MLNDFYQNIKFKEYINRYGIINAIKRGIFIANPLHYIGDYKLKKLLWQRNAARKIRKYLRYKDVDPLNLSFEEVLDNPDPIWMFWDSGIEHAPEIVQECYRSVVKYGGREVILLDKFNVGKYITFPQHIMDKVKKGNIPIAGFTDLLRFSLLEHYGGTWIDATVYLSDVIPEEVLKSNFFAFRNSMCLVDNPVLFPAWFLHAKANNITIRAIRNIAFAYWAKEHHVIEYLLPNLITTEVLKIIPDEMLRMPYMSSDYSEYLIRCLGEEYDKDKMKWICSLTSVHKLSYKLDSQIANSDNIYRHIINNDL